MSNIQPIVSTVSTVSNDLIKQVTAHKRNAKTLQLALSLFLDNLQGDALKERALRASAKLGREQGKAIDALPRDAGKLLQYVEGCRQKVEAIVARLPQVVADFATFNDCNAIKLESGLALLFITQFLNEYKEAKKVA